MNNETVKMIDFLMYVRNKNIINHTPVTFEQGKISVDDWTIEFEAEKMTLTCKYVDEDERRQTFHWDYTNSIIINPKKIS